MQSINTERASLVARQSNMKLISLVSSAKNFEFNELCSYFFPFIPPVFKDNLDTNHITNHIALNLEPGSVVLPLIMSCFFFVNSIMEVV